SSATVDSRYRKIDMQYLTRTAAGRVAAALILTISALSSFPSQPALAQQVSITQQLAQATLNLDAALAALDAGDVATARLRYGAYDDAWDELEDRIRDAHPDTYEAIERAMDQVEDALLRVDSPSPAAVTEALRALRQAIASQSASLG